MTTQEKKVSSVLDNFLKVEKPVVVSEEEKAPYFNMRISKVLREKFKRDCFMKNRSMTDVVTDFIFDQLENFTTFEVEKRPKEIMIPWNFRITSEKVRDDFHKACLEHGTDATTHITQFIRRQVENA